VAPTGLSGDVVPAKGGCPSGMIKCYQFVKGNILSGQLFYNCAASKEQCSKNRLSIGCNPSLGQACNCNPNTHPTGCLPSGGGAPSGVATKSKRPAAPGLATRPRRGAISAETTAHPAAYGRGRARRRRVRSIAGRR
jgi:hypothetical protein